MIYNQYAKPQYGTSSILHSLNQVTNYVKVLCIFKLNVEWKILIMSLSKVTGHVWTISKIPHLSLKLQYPPPTHMASRFIAPSILK